MSHSSSILPAGHPVQQMQGLAKQIALPGNHPPGRFPSFPALERTAVMGFNNPSSLVVPTNSTAHIFQCRQAAYPLWGDVKTPGVWTYTTQYLSDINPTGTGAGPISATFVGELSAGYVGSFAASYTRIGVTGGSFPPFQYPLVGVDGATNSMPWTYIPSNANAFFMVGGSTPFTVASNIALTYEVWDAPGEVHRSATTFVATTNNRSGAVAISGSSTFGFWIRPHGVVITAASAITVASGYTCAIMVSNATSVTFGASNADLGLFTLGGAPWTTLIPLSYPGEFSNSIIPWQSTRVTASACLLTNVTQVLYKGGTILCGRVAPATVAPWAVQSTYINNLHPAEKAFLPFETGAYTYCPPSTDMSTFYDYTCLAQVSGVLPAYRLDNDSLTNHLFFTPGANDETLALNLDWHVEFRTSSALFQIGLSTLSLESLHTAQIALAAAGFFFENPEHKGVLNKIVAATKKYGPSIVQAVHPVAGMALHKAIKMSNKSNSKMKTTSADASGFNGTKKKPKQQNPPKQGPKKQGKRQQ